MMDPSDTQAPAQPGPPIADTVDEVQGHFASDAALQYAIGLVMHDGFDRADLSLPLAHPSADEATPEQGAANPTTPADAQQQRTLHASMAGAVGALAAAGVTVATGGTAVAAVAAAAAVGLAAGGIAAAAVHASDASDHAARERDAATDDLVLSVRVTSAARRQRARELLGAAGATAVAAVTRRDTAVESGQGTD
jgi:hypothetical protein